jgi:hypothetical protein
VLPENAVPKFIVDSMGEHLNPIYLGEAEFISQNRSGTIQEFALSFNTIKFRYSSSLPDKILLNFNFNKFWSSNVGKVEEYNGLLSLSLSPGEKREVVLTFKDPNFSLGCQLALAALGLWALFVLWVFQRTKVLPRR